MLCWFLPYIKVNQPQVCILSPLPLKLPPISHPILPLQVVSVAVQNSLHHTANFHWVSNVIYSNVYISMFLPIAPVSFLCLHLHCCPAEFHQYYLDSIYMHQNTIFVFLFMTSLYYCKQCCNEQQGTCVFFNYGFLRVYMPSSGIVGSYGSFIPSLLK